MRQRCGRAPWRGAGWGSAAWHQTTGYFTAAMREVRRRFDAIRVDRLRVKPVVKITGEFYLHMFSAKQPDLNWENPRVRAEAEGRGVRVVQTYGMSETCGGCVYDGRPLDGVRVLDFMPQDDLPEIAP